MSKSRARLLAELLNSAGRVKKDKSDLAGADSVIDLDSLPTITNAKLENSSISIAGHSTALGDSVSLNTGDIEEHTNYPYFTNARARGAISVSGSTISYDSSTGVITSSANNYVLPTATSLAIGGVKIGYSENGKNYPVELSSGQMYVNVPWVDTNTTYSVGDGGLTQNNFTTTLKNKLDGIAASANNYVLPFTDNSSNWNTAHGWGNHASAGYLTSHQSLTSLLPKAGGTMTGELNIHKTNSAGILNLRNTSDSGTNPVAITFSSQGTSGTQVGHIKYTHSNALSYGANESFTFGGTESSTVILADGQFYYKDGIYKKPATGTGAGTRKDANWDTAYGWGNHASAGYLTSHQSLSAYAPLASPALTGTPTSPTASAGTNTTQIATTAFVGTAVSNLVDSSPSALNTLNELAAALGDDANFSTTVTNSIATKLPLSGGTVTGAGTTALKVNNTSGNGGYFNVTSNVGAVNTDGSVGLHIGWNKSNGGREVNMIFDGGTSQADTEMIFTSTDGSTYTDIFQINGATSGSNAGVDIKTGGLMIGGTRKDQNWDTAYGWGDHSTEGYLTSLGWAANDTFTGTYPIAWNASGTLYTASWLNVNGQTDTLHSVNFAASGTVTATGGNSTNWNTAYGWGDHSTAGYITDGNTNWNNSYGFITASDSSITNKLPLAGGTITGSITVRDDVTLGNYSTSDTGRLILTGTSANKQAIIKCTNGNLHIDSEAANSTYLNYYEGTGGVAFGNGAGATAAWMGPDGDLWKGSADNTGSKYWHAGNDGGGSGLDADLLDGYHKASLNPAHSHYRWTGISASGTTARRFVIMRLYGCPAHWDSNWQDIHFKVWSESYEATNLKYQLTGDYNGGTQSTMFQLRLKDAGGSSEHGRFRLVLGTPVDAGWDHSGQNTYYVDVYAEAAHYMNFTVAADFYSAGFSLNTLPTSGAATSVVYSSPAVSNITTFTEAKEHSYFANHKIWNDGNHGSGSGLDADTLDGQHGSFYLNAGNMNAGTLPEARLPTISKYLRSDTADTGSGKITLTATEGLEVGGIRGRAIGDQGGDFIQLYERVNIGYPSGWGASAASAPSFGLSTHGGAQFNKGNVSGAPFTFNSNTIWHAGNDGIGSGLDADTLDTVQASQFVRSDAADTLTGALTMNVSGSAITISSTSPQIRFNDTNNGDCYIHVNSDRFYILADRDNSGGWETPYPLELNFSNNNSLTFGNTIWTSGNDGTGSGLDADTLDTLQASDLARSNASWTSGAAWKQTFHSGSGGATFSNNHYSMGVDVANNAWSGTNYSDLIIGYHTGIRIGGGYSGVRFYNNSPTTDTNNDGNGEGNESLLMTVGGGGGSLSGANVTIENDLIVKSDVTINNRLYMGTGNNDGYFFSDSTGRTAYAGGDFYIQDSVSNCYIYATNTYLGAGSGDTIRFRGNTVTANNWGITAAGVITASGGGSANWNTAYGWGNHASAGYTTNLGFSRYNASTTYAFGNLQRFTSNTNIATASGTQSSLECFSSGIGTDAFMTFHVGSDFACYLGLDGGTNKLSVGGWSMGAVSYEIYHAGNKPSLATLGYTGATNANYITNNNQLTNGSGYLTASGTIAQSNYVSGSAFATTGSPGSVLEYQQATGVTDTKLAPSTDWYNTIRMGHGNPYSYYSNTLATKMTGGNVGQLYIQTISNNAAQGWRQIWDSTSDGDGSGLDADTVDGIEAASTIHKLNNTGYYRPNTWIDFRDAGAVGLYWGAGTAGGWHIYPTSNSNVQLRSGNSSVCQIAMNTNGTTRGYVYADNSNQIGFLNEAGNWRLKVQSAGSIYFGGTLQMRINSSSTTGILEALSTNMVYRASGGGGHSFQKSGGTALAKITDTGNFIALGNVTAYGSPSDINLKENIETISNAVEKVQKLDGVTFTYKKDGGRSTGLIAQQLQEVLPEVVYTTEDLSGNEHLAVRYGNTVGLLVEAIKELKQEIEDLKTELKEK